MKNKKRKMKKKLKVSIFVFITFACVFSCENLFSQETTQQVVQISADEAVERAIKNNLSLESTRTNLAGRKRASDLSWNQFVPELMVGGSFILNNEPEKINGTAFIDPLTETPITGPTSTLTPPGLVVMPYTMDGPQWNFAVPIQASFTLSPAMFSNMRRLKLDYESGLIAYDKAKLQLERDIRKAYNNLLMLQVNIQLLREHYAAMENRVQMAEANFRAGRAPELTWLQAQVAMENMKPTIDQAENGLRLSMASFAMLLGMDYDTQFELQHLENISPYSNEMNFVSLDVNEIVSQAAANKPDIQELRQTVQMLQSARNAQSNGNLPFFNASYNFTPVYIPSLNGPGGQKIDAEWRNTGSLTLTLGWRLHSLLPFSQGSQAVKAIDDQITTANIGLAQMVQGTEIEVYNIVLTLDRIRATTEAQRRTIELAERTYRLTQQAFQSGAQDLLQVQNAELELRQARVQMLEQQFNYLNGLLDLEYAIGVPFGTLSN